MPSMEMWLTRVRPHFCAARVTSMCASRTSGSRVSSSAPLLRGRWPAARRSCSRPGPPPAGRSPSPPARSDLQVLVQLGLLGAGQARVHALDVVVDQIEEAAVLAQGPRPGCRRRRPRGAGAAAAAEVGLERQRRAADGRVGLARAVGAEAEGALGGGVGAVGDAAERGRRERVAGVGLLGDQAIDGDAAGRPAHLRRLLRALRHRQGGHLVAVQRLAEGVEELVRDHQPVLVRAPAAAAPAADRSRSRCARCRCRSARASRWRR